MSAEESPTATDTSPPTDDDPDYKKIALGKVTFTISLKYIKSPLGILKAIVIVFSLIALICIAAGRNKTCDFLHGSSYGFFEFVGSTVFISDVISYIIFVVSIEGTLCFKLVPWLPFHVCRALIFALLYFIASIAVAVNSCYQDGFKCAAAFGFLTFFVLIVDVVFSIKKLREEHEPTNNRLFIMLGVEQIPPSSTTQTTNYDPESQDPKY